MTRAWSTPGNGLSTTSLMKDSQRFSIEEMSSLWEDTSELITSDLPIVPAIITVFARELETSVGPVKCWADPTVYY